MQTAGDVFQNSRNTHAFSAVAGQRHRVWGDFSCPLVMLLPREGPWKNKDG